MNALTQMKAMKHISNILVASLVWLLCVSCAVTDVDRSFDATHYHTYAWGASEATSKNPEYRGNLIDKRIKFTVDEEFAKRGIVRDAVHPDFFVPYTTFTEKRPQAYSNYPMYPFRLGYYPFAY